MWGFWTKTHHRFIYLFICYKLFPQILPAWILPLHGELTRVQFLTAPFLALQVNLGPFPANLSISQTDVRSDGSPVLFGSFVHRGHAHLAVTFRSPVVTQGLVLRGGERKRRCEKRGGGDRGETFGGAACYLGRKKKKNPDNNQKNRCPTRFSMDFWYWSISRSVSLSLLTSLTY